MARGDKIQIIEALQADILRLEGFKPLNGAVMDLGLGPIINAFPNATFPLGAVHEFLSGDTESAAATGFISGLLSQLIGTNGTAIWISSERTLFPPALSFYSVPPHRIIFIYLNKETDVVWAMEEALKCGALTAVICELREISFTASRRLQLAVEQSQVTGFILRRCHNKINTTACTSRWKIRTLPGIPIDDLPGVGYPRWSVELLRIKNGKPGIWEVFWERGKFAVASSKSHASIQGSSQRPESGNFPEGLPLGKVG